MVSGDKDRNIHLPLERLRALAQGSGISQRDREEDELGCQHHVKYDTVASFKIVHSCFIQSWEFPFIGGITYPNLDY